MDTTPKYIMMCNCSEIQDIVPKKVADDTGRKYIDGTAQVLKYHIGLGKLIWLPRQDQLQEMVNTYLFHIWNTGHETFYASASTGQKDSHRIGVFNSMEQLWLAFVMHEKFQKYWSEEKEIWVNIKQDK